VRNDLSIYERHADEWWDPRSPAFRSLRGVNAFRVELVREWLGGELAGATAVDVGCGGGLLAEPLMADGARVVGLDLSAASVRVASGRLGRRFVRGDALRLPLRDECAGVVMLADVLEHVPDVGAALREAARVLRGGGALYVNTINRTGRAKWIAVRLAEGVGLVPRGTHDPELFVDSDELVRTARGLGLELERTQGEGVDLARTIRSWTVTLRRSDDVGIGYSMLFRKRAPAAHPAPRSAP
jgi:2-polyprenyl-6-hydroxyphenyl methylase/3-demethylubiquinone-9 3-methyltransferase